MERFLVKRKWAILCALAVPACWLIIWPVANIGIVDDWSYVAMVKVLAQTGRLTYNGWAAPMIGAQAYEAAALVKFFGFSYTVVRFAVVIAAALTGYVCQRLLVRLGLNDGNAALVTLGTLFSTALLPMCYLFMTDIPGLLGMLGCLYGCVRAVDSAEDSRSQAWLLTAVAAAVLGGTCRQSAWLAGLTMVPCALWLLRGRRRVLASGVAIMVVQIVVIAVCVRWLNHQPFAQNAATGAFRGGFGVRDLGLLAYAIVHAVPSFLFLTLPVLVAYLMVIPFKNRRAVALGGVVLAVILLAGGVEAHRHALGPWMQEYVDGPVVLGNLFMAGWLPQELSDRTQGLLLLLALVSAIAFLSVCLDVRTKRANETAKLAAGISWWQMTVLVIPFCAAYALVLLPRAVAQTGIQSRYLIPLTFFAMAAAARLFQERVRPSLGLLSAIVVVATAAFLVVAIHDAFSRFRAERAAATQLVEAGVPAEAIDGGGEYDAETQIARYGFVNDPRMTVPAGVSRPEPNPESLGTCSPFREHAKLFPAVTPVYVLASDPTACGGKAGFAPVRYATWIKPHDQAIYVVKATR